MKVNHYKRHVKNILHNKSVLIFDFDGVIADSVEIKSNAFAELYRGYSTEIVNKIVNYHVKNGGVSRFDKIRYYQEEILGEDSANSKITEMANRFSKIVFDNVVSCKSIKGIEVFLEYYCTGKKKCYINTATPIDEMIRILKKRNQINFFTGVYGYPKSKIENLNHIASQYSVDDMVFFGDADTDLEASDRVGVDFIEIGSGVVVKNREDCYHLHNFMDL